MTTMHRSNAAAQAAQERRETALGLMAFGILFCLVGILVAIFSQSVADFLFQLRYDRPLTSVAPSDIEMAISLTLFGGLIVAGLGLWMVIAGCGRLKPEDDANAS